MVRALRLISVERGLDPREFALIAFGGAGPMHACALAEELGTPTVLVPRAGGVLSALGLAMSDLRRDVVAPFPGALADVDAAGMDEAFAALEERAGEDLQDARMARGADLRYGRQSFELTVPADEPGDLAERFHAAHERRHGYAMPEEPVELVALRVTATVARPAPGDPSGDDAPGDAGDGEQRTRRMWVDAEEDWAEVPVHDRERMAPGDAVSGPAIVELAGATCVVRAGWQGEIDDSGTLVLRRDA
jgi:N-methylhydantoinase A